MRFFSRTIPMDAARKAGHGIDWVALWILFSTWCTITGWFLSCLGCLNQWGYGLAFVLFLGGLIALQKKFGFFGQKPTEPILKILHSRWLLPKIWLLLAILVFIGGLIYHPNNYDYLTYRFPRVLRWCWEQHWHWIHSVNMRMNYSAAGFEWQMTPLFIFFKTDRLFFLINFIPFLFFPGLIFSVFCGLGISKRISWWWMWVLPTAYCYILQAGSVGNDFIEAVYLLAALHYAFKTADSSPTKNLILSLLAMALLTGGKASNIPLIIPWLIAVFFNREHLFKQIKPVVLVMAIFLAGMASFLPLALLNIHNTGDYSGDPHNQGKLKVSDPISGIIGNSLQIAVSNLSLPISLEQINWEGVVPASLMARLENNFQKLTFTSYEMQVEEKAGIGLGIVVGLGLMAGFGLGNSLKRTGARARWNGRALWIAVGGVMALLIYMSKIGSEAASRLVAAYYPLIIAGMQVLFSLDGCVIKRSLFKIVGAVIMLSALPCVIFNPARPLFPIDLTVHYLERVAPSVVVRFSQVYNGYSSRYDVLRDLRPYLPENENRVGFLQDDDDPETSLWQPFGRRQVIDVTPEKSIDDLKGLRLHYIVVHGDALDYKYHITIDELTKKWAAKVVVKKDIIVKIHIGPRAWYLLHCP